MSDTTHTSFFSAGPFAVEGLHHDCPGGFICQRRASSRGGWLGSSESTDDAQEIDGHIVPTAARVQGTVLRARRAGQPGSQSRQSAGGELDPRDYELASRHAPKRSWPTPRPQGAGGTAAAVPRVASAHLDGEPQRRPRRRSGKRRPRRSKASACVNERRHGPDRQPPPKRASKWRKRGPTT